MAAQLQAQAPVADSLSAPARRVEGGAVRTAQPPTIDGRPDEAAWQSAPALSGFIQREPVEGRQVSERTEVRILFDDQALYVGARLLDSQAGGIVVGETRRDAELTDSDAFLLVLDTFRDGQNGFVFGTTPAGIEYDGQISREGQGGGRGARQQAGSGGGFNKNWDGSWDVATSRDAEGWYAEFRIPFSTLRYGAPGAQSWGMNLVRRIRRRSEEAFWSPIPRQFDLYRVSLAGTLNGVVAPSQRTLSITPYVLASTTESFAAGTGASSSLNAGGDAKIGVTPSLTLDLTYNTDFAQVEVDEEQLNLTRYRLFFPEKRPFFLENAGTFSVGSPQEVELFFSRRIGIEQGRAVPIRAGGRVSGKIGGLTVGLLDIQTGGLTGRDPRNPDQQVALADPTNYSVVRLLRDLPNRSRIGGVFVGRVDTDTPSDHGLTYGIDGRLGIGRAITLDGYAAGTSTSDGDDDDAGYAYSLGGNYTGSDWRFGGSFREVSDRFDPQVGFLPRRGYRSRSARVLRAIRFASLPWFRELRPHASYQEYLDLDGFSESRFIHIDSHFEFANGAFFQLPALNFVREGLKEPFEISRGVVVRPGTYDNFEWGFEFNTDQSAPLSVDSRIDIGGFYSGRRAGTATTLNGRVSDKFVAGLRVSYYDVDLAEGSFQTSLIGLRAAYSFTPRMYLQSLVQYNDQSHSFSSNVRFGWLSTAGTGLFVVFNDNEQADLFDRRAVPRRPLDRTLVIKFTRQFDLGS